MSWDKNTINMSRIDTITDVLKDAGIGYNLLVLAKVRGRGLNDSDMFSDKETYYELRRLEYGNTVYLDKIEQDADCDVDDVITSHKFTKETEPKNWIAVIQTDYTGEYSEA